MTATQESKAFAELFGIRARVEWWDAEDEQLPDGSWLIPSEADRAVDTKADVFVDTDKLCIYGLKTGGAYDYEVGGPYDLNIEVELTPEIIAAVAILHKEQT